MVLQNSRQSPSPLQLILNQIPLAKITATLAIYIGIYSLTNYEKPIISHPARLLTALAAAAIVEEQIIEYQERCNPPKHI